MYGTQQPIALLKLLLERGGMYDRGKDLNWKMYKDIGFLAAMGKVIILCNLLMHVLLIYVAQSIMLIHVCMYASVSSVCVSMCACVRV